MFQKMLIANRGEIAIRIVRACQELGIATVAVYTELDRESRHVTMADQAFNLGSATYLDMAAIWDVAKAAGCDAIHPGYGFLAENEAFAAGTVARGLAWVGPKADAIAEMGSKLAARRIAIEHHVPLVPGTTEPVKHADEIRAFGEAHGYPILIKAAAGGGGRGQVVISGPDEIQAGFERAQREGLSYFASDEVYIERFLTQPRHIEVQVVADKHGTTIHLGERDCTIQRRNQKVVEEAPSPALTPAERAHVGELAVTVARAVGYDSVGTVECMYEDGQFYFLEMNTRIQVEHTVTELVYDCDLVKTMIRIAAGEKLDPALIDRQPRGWAIQCRINAEDPTANYRPTPGKLTRYDRPEGPGVRLDSAAYEGWTIPSAYDNMIAKLITWGANREEAIARMRRALKEMVVEGVPTIIPLHQVIMENPVFIAGAFSTSYLKEALSETEWDRVRAMVGAGALAPEADEPATRRTFAVEVNRQRFHVTLSETGGTGATAVATRTAGPAKPARPGAKAGAAAKAGDGSVVAPMMSRVVKVCVEPGAEVKAGQPLVVVEAMKMESELLCPKDGTVGAVNCAVGDTVEQGKVLVKVD